MTRLLASAIVIGSFTLGTMQFVQPTISSTPATNGHDLLNDGTVDPTVRSVLKRACSNCHSNKIEMPWYGRVSPVSWMIARHVEQGRRKLNFSEWPRNAADVKEDIADSVDKHEMPLRAYTWIHASARLSAADRKAIDEWADAK